MLNNAFAILRYPAIQLAKERLLSRALPIPAYERVNEDRKSLSCASVVNADYRAIGVQLPVNFVSACCQLNLRG